MTHPTDEKTVQEGNKIIAEFDGYEIDESGRFWRNKMWTGLSGLRYDTDWNRLMPVVKKVFETYPSLLKTGAGGLPDNPSNEINKAVRQLEDSLINVNIKSTWRFAITLIQFFNAKNK